ncbi:hypothetical protein GCM10020220_039750 [Nonomuraea rubra]
MTEALPRREPGPVRHLAWITDVTLAVVTLVFFVAVALATGIHSRSQGLTNLTPWHGPIQLGLYLGALLLVRRRWPMAVLLLSVGGMFAYHLLAGIFSPAGWIWPVAVAYFTAATTSRVRWVAAVGVAQLGYSAIDAGILLDRNVPRYVIHVAGEGLLLAALIAAGLTYAAAVRRRERVRETDGRARAAEERLRVSHEVHDAIAHTLAIVGVQLNVAADALDEGGPGRGGHRAAPGQGRAEPGDGRPPLSHRHPARRLGRHRAAARPGRPAHARRRRPRRRAEGDAGRARRPRPPSPPCPPSRSTASSRSPSPTRSSTRTRAGPR